LVIAVFAEVIFFVPLIRSSMLPEVSIRMTMFGWTRTR